MKELGGNIGVLVGLDLPSVGGETEAGIRSHMLCGMVKIKKIIIIKIKIIVPIVSEEEFSLIKFW